VYVVQPSDTLYSIAWRYHLDYRELARRNHIGSDYRISVGQRLSLAPASLTSSPNAAAATSKRAAPASALSWTWPTAVSAPPRSVTGGGILISGQLGQEVRAASAGRVVYAGSGIRGYGNLIILKHPENLLSAYAHNRELKVREGEEVVTGQVIGLMGEGAPQKPVLYFEIRRGGKPVDPLPFLPARMLK
jgi:lipoprotein NlpD